MSRDIRYFGPHREPAVLVEDFEELREGMVVWNAACPRCQKDERSILLARYVGEIRSEGVVVFVEGWIWEGRSCTGSKFDVLSDRLVHQRRLFRVIDEPPAKAESRTRRRKLVTS